ncbi:MAG TPA: FAD-dependent oxidoreductase [Gemmataceae bacterium]|jgi:2-polyprenyl-6-methoxyphenol hydroxylase-like FAD-dependent oxidoreductase
MDENREAGDLASEQQTRCCVVGAGPAGAVLGLLLARGGVPVTLLEAHPDFDRDFRGDTVHPPTLELLAQLGLADRLHALPHSKVRVLQLRTKTRTFTLANLGRLRIPFPYVMILPQAKLLQLLTDEARRFPHFRLVMRANVQRLVEADGAVRGVCYRDPENNWHEVRADLTVAADGRFSKVRHLAGIEPVKSAPPMDVVWFRLPRKPADAAESAALYTGGGRFAVVLDRGEEWQVGYVILKGSFAAVKAAGVGALRQGLADLIPWLADRVEQLHGWEQVAVLNVESSRVERWHKPGLLLIGDAAHVMSPVAGVGINVAIQDAVAAANLLTGPLRRGTVTEADLAAVQKEREYAVKVVQRIQQVIQDRIAAPGLDVGHEFRPPWWLRLITSVPGLRNLPARLLAFGPNRVRLRDAPPPA